ncbi:MAG: UDP-N-acetylmuramate dehydrogenase [Candidatus Berkiella sp.]
MLQESHEGDEFALPTFEGEQLNFPLASLTSWHIGGKAERFYLPTSIEQLSQYLSALPHDTPITWLGLGSNVLIKDSGIKGAVICTRKCQELYEQEDGSLYVQAGVTCAKFARFASKRGFAKAAFFAGIPGTIGGALAMNAGAFGGETWEWVQSVLLMDCHGKQFERHPHDYDIAYRSVHAKQGNKEDAFMGAVFRFPKEQIDGMEKIRELLKKRSQTQPIGTFNCGSVYRNPPGDFAARLIEACDLKGYRIGDAIISEKHANFIINCKQARAVDVEALMKTIESAVWDRFKIRLQPEVRILG